VYAKLLSRFPHAVRAAGLVVVALAGAAVYNAANPEGMRWTLSPDGRVGLPRVFESRLREISADEAWNLFKTERAIFLDARDEQDYRQDHIPGAINLPMRKWNQVWPRLSHRLPKESAIVLYCYGGKCGLSTRMGKRLLELGWERPLVLRRGWPEWKEAGFPSVRQPGGKRR
jgi:rhodanese-related sulfurtransferase